MRPLSRSFCCLLSVALFFLAAEPTRSATVAPFISVSPSWRPPKQLTTIDVNGNGDTDPGDDIRYAAIDIFVTTNVEFSTVGFTCTVNKLALESYVQNGDPGSADDSLPMFTVGADWTSTTKTSVDTTDTDGKFVFAVSVAFPYNPPMGQEGVTQTLHVATLRYRVKEGLAAATTSTFTCTSAFYDVDGMALPMAKSLPPPALGIVPGYTLSGKVTYQGITVAPTAAQSISILCDDSDGDTTFDDVVTTANPTTGGVFQVNNLRTPGRYDCQFVGNIVTPGTGSDLHLMGVTDFNLSTANLALLPTALKAGNVDRTGGNVTIDGADLTMVTSNWNVPQPLPFQSGDANGDRKINEVDLGLVSGNFGMAEPVRAHHLIYSLPRDEFAFQNSRIWLGSVNSPSVKRFVSGTSRDYWPAVSPDGMQIAFVRNVGTNGLDKFALFVAPVTKGVVGAPKRITLPTDTYDAFAPGWSPDGSQLAFVCSYNQAWLDASTASGQLCLIDSSGRNFRRPIEANTKRTIPVKVQAPSWLNAQNISFAYSPDPDFPSLCDNKVCILNLPSYVQSNPGALPSNIDLPVVRDSVLGLTLFYRFDDGAGNRTLRFAQVSAGGLPFASYPNGTPGTMHLDVPGMGSTSVDYFTVSTGADPDIVFYNSNPAGGVAGGSTFFTKVFTGTAAVPNWAPVTVFSYGVSNGLGNPDFTSDYNLALRNTAAFLP